MRKFTGLIVVAVLLFWLCTSGKCSELKGESGYVPVAGAEIYYEVYGSGSPILLLAGLASDSHSWGRVIAELSREHRVIVLDNRACGRTRSMGGDITIFRMAADAVAVLKHLGISKTVVLGHSMGGFIALDIALYYPEYVTKLILVATSAANSAANSALFANWVRALAGGRSLRDWYYELFSWIFTPELMADRERVDAMLEAVLAYPYRQSAGDFTAQVQAIENFGVAEQLSSIKCETLVICGEKDRLFSPEESRNSLERIPRSTFKFIPGAAHSVHSEKPEEFVAVVEEFSR